MEQLTVGTIVEGKVKSLTKFGAFIMLPDGSTGMVHISEVSEREAFRRVSYIRDVAVKTICGHGLDGYNEALDFLIDYIGEKNEG